jgi:ABC-type lipoprotein release transport system permease subunit
VGFGLSALVGLLAALAPAWQASRAEIVSSLRRV